MQLLKVTENFEQMSLRGAERRGNLSFFYGSKRLLPPVYTGVAMTKGQFCNCLYLRARRSLRCLVIGAVVLFGWLYFVPSSLAQVCEDYPDQACTCSTSTGTCPDGKWSAIGGPGGCFDAKPSYCDPPKGIRFICCSNTAPTLCEGACYSGGSCPVDTESAAGKCKKAYVCCKEKKKEKKAISTKADCEADGGSCAIGSGCDGSKLESAIGTCEGGVSCCKKNSELEASAKKFAEQGSTTVLEDPLKGAGISAILGRLVSTFMGLAGALALLAFVWAGVIYMTAGDSDRIKQAQSIMKSTGLGLIILIFAYTIARLFFDVLVK